MNTLLYSTTTKFVEKLIVTIKKRKQLPTRWSPNGKSEI